MTINLTDPANQLTDNKLTKIIESAEAVISALAGTNEDVHPDNSTQMCRLWDTLNDNDATPEAVLAMARELHERRKAAAEPVMYVMGMGRALDAETASTCKGAVDSWVGEWNRDRLPGQTEYKTVPLYAEPQPLNDAERAELQEHRKAAEPELKPANLINKFYERYPVASFKSDPERAAALGYFMAGAELQCFGEFVKYEDMFCDE